MSQYFLRNDVYLCIDKGAAIFLDTRRGGYFGLNQSQANALRSAVMGWPEGTPASETALSENQQDCSELMKTLLRRELLTVDRAIGKDVGPPQLERADSQLPTSEDEKRVRIQQFANLLFACVAARGSLELRSFASALHAIRRRKHQALSSASAPNVALVSDLLGVFFRVRPFFYTVKDACLFDSFVLVEFLARYRIYPEWVIGVVANPFAAHSWVQMGRYVLNGIPATVQRFTPIVVI